MIWTIIFQESSNYWLPFIISSIPDLWAVFYKHGDRKEYNLTRIAIFHFNTNSSFLSKPSECRLLYSSIDQLRHLSRLPTVHHPLRSSTYLQATCRSSRSSLALWSRIMNLYASLYFLSQLDTLSAGGLAQSHGRQHTWEPFYRFRSSPPTGCQYAPHHQNYVSLSL